MITKTKPCGACGGKAFTAFIGATFLALGIIGAAQDTQAEHAAVEIEGTIKKIADSQHGVAHTHGAIP